jgi:hypothetical protein
MGEHHAPPDCGVAHVDCCGTMPMAMLGLVESGVCAGDLAGPMAGPEPDQSREVFEAIFTRRHLGGY